VIPETLLMTSGEQSIPATATEHKHHKKIYTTTTITK